MRVSARHAGDSTRTRADGPLVAALTTGGLGRAWQQPDGIVQLRAPDERGLLELRFVLALDDDHSEFLEQFRDDPLLRRALPRLRGLRPLRLGTVTHSLLRAVCGQLIQARLAREIERNVIRASSPRVEGTRLRLPPTAAALARFAPAELRRLGLGARRGATLVRLCRSIDLERLRSLPTDAAAERLERERGLGPWSVGVICLEGLGRFERGLVGDLGLVKLCSAMLRAEGRDLGDGRAAGAVRPLVRARERLPARRVRARPRAAPARKRLPRHPLAVPPSGRMVFDRAAV